MMEFLKEFLKNPLRTKYIPALICLGLGAMWFALTHSVVSIFTWIALSAIQAHAAGTPLRPVAQSLFILMAAVFGAFAIYLVFAGAFLAAVVSGAVATLPLSIVFTRKVEG